MSVDPFAEERVDETPDSIVAFWRDAGPDRWFEKDDAFDRVFRQRFLPAHMAASRRRLDGWMATPEGCLALVILLDQFPRNAFRDCAHMFATDALGQSVARHMLANGFDQAVGDDIRVFCYLPFSHAESLADQDLAVAHNEPLGDPYLKFARIHRDVIRRFGRFPHRNHALGRDTTAEEQAFLDEGGFAG